MIDVALRLALVLVLSTLVLVSFRLGRGARFRAHRHAHDRPARRWSDLMTAAAGLVVVLALIGVFAAFMAFGGNLEVRVPATPTIVELKETRDEKPLDCGRADPRGQPIRVEVLHSDDLRPWFEHAADIFMRRCPNIQLRLIARDDLAAADAILRGELRPTLWAPADELSLRYVDARWRARSDEVLFQIDEQRSLAHSPLVLLLREDRLRALKAIRAADRDGLGFWVDAPCATLPREPSLDGRLQEDMLPGYWLDWYVQRNPPPPPPEPAPAPGRRTGRALVTAPAVPPTPPDPLVPTFEELRSWGRVKLEFPAPTRSAGGLSALVLMARQYLVGDAADGFDTALERDGEALKRWLRRCNAGREAPLASAVLLTDHFFDVGPVRYDGVVTYEQLAFSILTQLKFRELGELRVYYPQTSFVAAHPAVLMWPDVEDRRRELDAARRWLEYLESEEIQQRAVTFGLRPARLGRPLQTLDLDHNPFLELRRFGVELEPVIDQPPRPDGQSLRRLIELWGDATGRN